MTGYGRKEIILDGKKICCEIKSVNHRYLDCNIKVPRYYGFLEEKVREFVSKKINRGKVDVYVSVEAYETSDTQICINMELAQNYMTSLKQLVDEFKIKDDISASSVARFPDVLTAQRVEEDEEKLTTNVLSVLDGAVLDFIDMRKREGDRIEADLVQRIEYMKTVSRKIEERSPETVFEYREKLYQKIKEVLEDRAIDEARILTEVAIFADKIAVNEETVRLNSHFNEFYEIISKDEPAGRRLDFLIQEINREVNTTGSKANDIEIAKMVVELKGEIEKLREQVQNIE